ncbi:hypothetical protein M6D93_03585 [Jatrophihabitans telluris]|uniref:Sucrase ferredoxin n=1 Tax=Jatrophihabitans telluris TaxID=2038343 RepID=A0ABY4R1F2_9ACTN|nr:sucrase ferredoxin [Jatrophihabitans telluris]UQX89091.1 hypothetical protein M6D93_03585 [Jatrophihabitans telluris]
MLGTAFPAARVLLIEQPGGWGPDGLVDSGFDLAIAKRLISGLSRIGIRVQTIRRPGRAPSAAADRGGRRWAFVDVRPGHAGMVWGEYRSDSDLLTLDPDEALRTAVGAGTDERGSHFFVCAHGRHDVCCAIEGRPVAAALQDIRPGKVWECSHLGGDRFAANVLVLPLGVVYGLVPASGVEDLAAASDRSELLLPWLRGRIGTVSVAQAALAMAHRELGYRSVHDLRVLDHFRLDSEKDGARTALGGSDPMFGVRIATPEGDVLVTVQVSTAPAEVLTCRAVRPSRAALLRPRRLERL